MHGLGPVVLLGIALLLVGCSATKTTSTSRSVTAPGGSPDRYKVIGPRPATIVYRPAGLSRRHKVPLVIGLYGATGCPQCMEGLTKFELVGRRHGFVVAYPGSNTNPPWHSPGDIHYFSALIDRLRRTQNIDPKRIYVAGFSAGGREAYFVGCKLSSRIAAIAVVSSVMRQYPCPISHPVSMLTIAGSTEAINGTPTTPSLASAAVRWRTLDGCPSLMTARRSQVADVTQQTWGPCQGGSTVAIYVVQGGHHTWPGTYGLAPSDPDAQWKASEGIWSFFAAHPLVH
jgi:polyhydroxybutyrate depolymerase